MDNMSYYEERKKRTKWFIKDRFGMFIHWGLYAIPARGEWIRYSENISNEDYQKYFDSFNPTHYHPEEWAKLAKRAGMKYAVMTTKHHDGFCLFDSKYTEYKATNTQAGRDLIREYVDAFRAEGIKVGFYYSLLDWYHADYPHYGDRYHPMRANKEYENTQHNFKNYTEYLHNQVRELMTNYGKIDILWFDFSYNDMIGDKWEAARLVNMIRELQPDIVLNNRLNGAGTIDAPNNNDKSVSFSGDFVSPEQCIPPKGIVDEQERSIPWESCITLNDHWGYCAVDKKYKSSQTVIKILVDCVSKDGNLILNVGPNAKGEIPKESVSILNEIGDWMAENGESIHGCGAANLEKMEWGHYTRNKDQLYAHIFDRGLGVLHFNGLNGKVEGACLLSDESEVQTRDSFFNTPFENDLIITLDADMSNSLDTVVKFNLK